MNLSEYFDKTTGRGILSTSDKEGKVNAAIYARPHLMEDKSLVFIMRDRLSHANLQTNPYAVYLFIENGKGYRGKRLYLKKKREEENADLVNRLRRRQYIDEKDERRFVVYFTLEKELPLIGSES